MIWTDNKIEICQLLEFLKIDLQYWTHNVLVNPCVGGKIEFSVFSKILNCYVILTIAFQSSSLIWTHPKVEKKSILKEQNIFIWLNHIKCDKREWWITFDRIIDWLFSSITKCISLKHPSGSQSI